jgi:predicted RNA-binding Zn-ribbon protein involved in translation (DUF1610 family)
MGKEEVRKKMLTTVHHEIGKVIWLEGHVFVCPQCDKRQDYAIIFKDHPQRPVCISCQADLDIDEASPRIMRDPIKFGW